MVEPKSAARGGPAFAPATPLAGGAEPSAPAAPPRGPHAAPPDNVHAEPSPGPRAQSSSDPAGDVPGEAIVAMLRAVRDAPDDASVVAVAVDALADGLGACVWVAADPERAGLLEVVASAGAGSAAIASAALPSTSGDELWRDACEAAGLTLRAWQPLDAASLPSAFLGLATTAEAGFELADAAGIEVARFIGLAADARADRVAAGRLLATSGRLAWLETVRHASRSARHDLANVLTGISFYGSQIAADLPPGTTTAADAVAIGDTVARGSHLLARLRDLWREASETEVVPLDPAAVVDGMVALLAPVAEPCALRIAPLESMVVRASRRSLEESVMALVVDLREAAATGGVGSSAGAIRVGVVAEVLGEGNTVGLCAGRYAAVVVDDDESDPDETVAAAPGSFADTSPGAPGFGPALAAAFARAAGGALRVERTRGGGTRTTILLPEAVSRSRHAAGSGRASDSDQPGLRSDAPASDRGRADG